MELSPNTSEAQEIRERVSRDYQERITKAEKAICCVDAEYVFQALVCSKLFSAAKGFFEAEHGLFPALLELAAYYLYPHFGSNGDRDPGKVQAAIDALTELNNLRGLHTAFDRDPNASGIAMMQVQLQLSAEAIRGSSYPPLIRDRIVGVQVPFERWFANEVGIGPEQALAILDASEKAMNDNFQIHRTAFQAINTKIAEIADRTHKMSRKVRNQPICDAELPALGVEFSELMEGIPTMLPSSFSQIAAKVPGLTLEGWIAFRKLVGFTPEERHGIQKPSEIKTRPVYFLSEDRFIFFDLASAYDALFEAYDQITRNNLPFRDKKYVPNLARWMESKTYDCLCRLFPAQTVHQQLTYPNPDPVGGEAELDAAVLWGPFLILCEVKGKQFRPRSRLGDCPRLYDDLKDNIAEAFDQASRATHFIEAQKAATFIEKSTGRKLVIKNQEIQRIFPVSITLHHFSGLATQLAALKQLGLFQDSAYPWSVSLSDFDIITRFAASPDVFLHYIQRRLDLQRSEKQISGDELDIFGLYLDSRLHPSQYWNRKTDDGKEYDRLVLSGGSDRFDQWFQAEHSSQTDKPDIRLKLPPNFAEIIGELRTRDDDGARWVAFALLGLSQDTVSSIEQSLISLRKQARADNRLRRFTINDGDLVVSLVTAVGLSKQRLRGYASFRAAVEKYRSKTEASVALSIDPSDTSKPFDFAFWISGPWEEDAALAEFISDEKPKLLPGQRLPTRNEPCPCSSGKKFKKCCIAKFSVLPPESV